MGGGRGQGGPWDTSLPCFRPDWHPETGTCSARPHTRPRATGVHHLGASGTRKLPLMSLPWRAWGQKGRSGSRDDRASPEWSRQFFAFPGLGLRRGAGPNPEVRKSQGLSVPQTCLIQPPQLHSATTHRQHLCPVTPGSPASLKWTLAEASSPGPGQPGQGSPLLSPHRHAFCGRELVSRPTGVAWQGTLRTAQGEPSRHS